MKYPRQQGYLYNIDIAFVSRAVCRVGGNSCNTGERNVADENWRPNEVTENDATACLGSGTHSGCTARRCYVDYTESEEGVNLRNCSFVASA